MDVLTSSRLTGGNPAGGRKPSDFYPTPPEVTEALLRHLKIPLPATIWEPACGEGHMSEVIASYGYNVVSSDLHDTGYGQACSDFLTSTCEICDWIITNPPFSLAEQFIRRCRELDKPFALLLKTQFWHAAKRIQLFEEIRPTKILPLTWRPDFTGGGSSLMDCIWCVWNGENPTSYALLKKPEKGQRNEH